MKILIFTYIFIWHSFLFMFSAMNKMAAQETFAVTLGAGWFFEGYNLGIKGRIGHFQIGGNYGAKSLLGDNIQTYGLHAFYYLPAFEKILDRRVLYVRTGFIHYTEKLKKWGWINSRIGSDINISKKFGFQIDIGFMYFLYRKYFESADGTWYNENVQSFWPTGGLTFYLRL